MMRASIRQVAEKAQVGRSTVSRVLRGHKTEVSPETYEKVLAVIHEMNYVPVQSAVQKHHVKTNCIGLVPQHRDAFDKTFDTMTFNGLCKNASRHGYDLFVMLRGEAEWMANREELRFLDRRSDGFIFISGCTNEWQTTLETLVEHEIPVVVCFRRDVPEGVAWVDPDNEEIIRLAVEHLWSHGHRKLAFIGGPNPNALTCDYLSNIASFRYNYDTQKRVASFTREVQARDLYAPLNVFYSADPDWKITPDDLRPLIECGATGIVCVNDLVALQVWENLERLGYAVPRDFSIVGTDDDAGSSHRGLTCISFGYDTLGRLAVESWLKRQSGADASDCCEVVPVQLIERLSVGPPRSSS